MLTALLVAFASLATAADDHPTLNPVYRQLLGPGIEIGSSSTLPVPTPLMPDGLDAEEQERVIQSLLPEGQTMARMMRNSVVAPQVIQMAELADPAAPARRVDCWFIAYGDLSVLTEEEFLKSLVRADAAERDGDEEGRGLEAEDLSARGITILPENTNNEAYVHGRYTLINRVELHGTLRAFWSETPDSIVVAAILDPRFLDDEKYPNRWHPVSADELGRLQTGPGQPYGGMGMYMKATRLAEPEGALLIEWHVVFSEPHAWFDGANLLGSKLPAVIQNQVRTARREIVKASRDGSSS